MSDEMDGYECTVCEYTYDRYECTVCEYTYDPNVGDTIAGISPGMSFDALPDDWVCPVCGAGRAQFGKVQE